MLLDLFESWKYSDAYVSSYPELEVINSQVRIYIHNIRPDQERLRKMQH